MSRVDLQNPEQLVDARRELLEAVRESERIVVDARIAVTQLLDEARRRLAVRQAAVRDVESRMTASPEHAAGLQGERLRVMNELAGAVQGQSDISTRANELLATIVRATSEIRVRGTDGAGFLATYHARLTGARAGFAARGGTAASGGAAGGMTVARQATQSREAAIAAAREAVRAALGADGVNAAALTAEEAEAIRRYTSNERLEDWHGRWYEIGNAILRGARQGPNRGPMTLADLERFERAGSPTAGIAAALRGLRKLPTVSGNLHRGIGTQGWGPEERATFMKQFIAGRTYRDAGLFSASWRKSVAQSYAGSSGIMFHVAAKTARSVESLSAFGPIEHEAVLPPFTQFRVRRVRNEGSGLTRIWLDELEE